jgi:anaerobic magnesium-protoporphyrin IX monomethyl ester cyclase
MTNKRNNKINTLTMTNKKILFITPPYHAGVVEVAGSWIPLYLVYLAGAAKKSGFDAEIYDAMTKKVGYEEIEKKIVESSPDFVGVSTITCTVPDAIKVIELAKRINPNIKTILGGVHASLMYHEMFSLTDSLDFIVRGEGELTIPELLNALSHNGDLSRIEGIIYKNEASIWVNPPRPLMESIDELPMSWELLDWEDYSYFILPGSRLGAISTSRGCDKECTFCSQQKYWLRKWRARSPEDIIQEMILLRTRYDVDVVLLTDEYPTADRDRWERLLDLIIVKNLGMKILMETRAADIVRDEDILDKYKKAGIIHIYVGTEATQQESLDYLKKDLSIEESKKALKLLRDRGIITETSMILGYPDETEDSIAKTLELAIEFNPDFAHFLAIAPWPYADIYNDLKDYIAVTDYRKYNLIDPIVKPKAMTLEELDKAIVDCYRGFYMNKYAEMKVEEKNEFKKKYMITSMKLMMSNSFIKKKMGNLGEIPEEVKKIIESSP